MDLYIPSWSTLIPKKPGYNIYHKRIKPNVVLPIKILVKIPLSPVHLCLTFALYLRINIDWVATINLNFKGGFRKA